MSFALKSVRVSFQAQLDKGHCLCFVALGMLGDYTIQSQKHRDEVDSRRWGTATNEDSFYMQLHKPSGGTNSALAPLLSKLSAILAALGERSPFAEVTDIYLNQWGSSKGQRNLRALVLRSDCRSCLMLPLCHSCSF